MTEQSLVFSSTETKLMIITSKQMTRVHNLDDKVTTFAVINIKSM